MALRQQLLLAAIACARGDVGARWSPALPLAFHGGDNIGTGLYRAFGFGSKPHFAAWEADLLSSLGGSPPLRKLLLLTLDRDRAGERR